MMVMSRYFVARVFLSRCLDLIFNVSAGVLCAWGCVKMVPVNALLLRWLLL